MRTTEERVLAVKSRIKEIEDQKRAWKGRMTGISSLAACLMFIAGLSFVMPGVMDSMADGDYANLATTASIFEKNNFLGYILIGLIAFALGISVTILSYKIKLMNFLNQEDKGEDYD